MDNKTIDGMKNEGRLFRNGMIFSYIFAILLPLTNYLMNNGKPSNKDLIIIFFVCFMFGTYGLYRWLCAIKYRVEFNNEKVCLKNLFQKIEFNICDVEKYTCNRYKKSVFYQFDLFIKGKKIFIYTRYKDEFEKVLRNNKIEQIIK